MPTNPPGSRQRATLSRAVSLPPALGVLSRREVRVRLLPAEPGAGIIVARADTGESWPATIAHVTGATHCTAIGTADSSVAYVEHALAALWAAGISDALISTDGPELPLYDGSARVWWEALREAERVESATALEPLILTEACYVAEGDRALIGLPDQTTSFSYVLEYDHPLIGRQWARWSEGGDFGRDLAAARTFATEEQVKALTGMAQVGPEVEAMAVVVYADRFSTELPSSHAFARHKLVDLLGDLYLAGRPLVGAVVALKTGHGDNHRFLREVLARCL